jgi:hypothetical protein
MVGGIGDVVLYTVALAAAIWALVPAAAFALGLMRLRTRTHPEPARAEPTADDADYARRFGQFAALGYRALGFSVETCWFLNPLTWYWRSFSGTRWMAAADGKTLVSFHRHLADEPVRFGAVTLFDDGGLVRTACPGAGVIYQDGNFLRMEVRGVEPVELLSKHEIHVMAFATEGNRHVKDATLEEVVRIEAEHDVKVLKQQGNYWDVAAFFVLPAVAAFWGASGAILHRVAVAACVGGAAFAVLKFVIIPRRRRRRVIASHTEDAAGAGNMMERNQRAKNLLREKRYEEATDEFVWLWNNVERVDPSMSGVRVSFMAGEIERLVAEYPPARQRFAELRDQAAAATDANPTAADPRTDWAVLNKVLGDDDRTIAWFDKAKEDPAAVPVIEGLSVYLEELLKARGRWADVGRLVRDPMAKLDLHHSMLRHMEMPLMRHRLGDEAFARMRDASLNLFRRAVADLVASLRAAGRHDDAVAVRDKALILDPSGEMKQALEQPPKPGPALA